MLVGRVLRSVVECFRDAPWLNRQRLLAYPKLLLAVYLLTYAVWVVAGPAHRNGKPIGADFASFWAASAAALRGQPSAVYNLAQHHAMEQAAVGQSTFINPWYYPPMFLVIVLPLALAPYFWSLAAWTALTMAGYLFVVWKITSRREAFWLALAFPGAIANLVNGQNGFLTFSLLGGALLLLDDAPVLAGVLFGLLTYKPQIGVLVPIVLIATGRWRAFFTAAITAICFAGISLMMFGPETWRAFFASLDLIRHLIVERGGVRFFTMQSAFAGTRLLGGSIAAAYTVQACVFLLAAVSVLIIWRSEVRFPIKAAALVVGAMLSSIHLIYYDLVVLGLPIAWLAVEGERDGFLPFEKSLLVAAWILPMVSEFVAQYLSIPLTPVIGLLMLAALLRRTRTPDIANERRANSMLFSFQR